MPWQQQNNMSVLNDVSPSKSAGLYKRDMSPFLGLLNNPTASFTLYVHRWATFHPQARAVQHRGHRWHQLYIGYAVIIDVFITYFPLACTEGPDKLQHEQYITVEACAKTTVWQRELCLIGIMCYAGVGFCAGKIYFFEFLNFSFVHKQNPILVVVFYTGIRVSKHPWARSFY